MAWPRECRHTAIKRTQGCAACSRTAPKPPPALVQRVGRGATMADERHTATATLSSHNGTKSKAGSGSSYRISIALLVCYHAALAVVLVGLIFLLWPEADPANKAIWKKTLVILAHPLDL